MPAVNLAQTFPQVPAAGFACARVPLGDAGDATLITIPSWCRRASVTFLKADDTDDAGSIYHEGTQDAAISDDAYPIGAGVEKPIAVQREAASKTGERTFAVSGATAAGFCKVFMEQES